MFSHLVSIAVAVSFAGLVAAAGPACMFTAPASCGLSQDMVMHLGLQYQSSQCTVTPATSPGVDPHAGHDMGRRLADADQMASWMCDAGRTALGCTNAKIMHSMAHDGSNTAMPHYMSVCMPAKVAASEAQVWWDAYVAADECTANCAQQQSDRIRVGLELENDVSSAMLDNVMSYINKAAVACSAATTEAACTDASNTVAMMQVPTTTSSAFAAVSSCVLGVFAFLAMCW